METFMLCSVYISPSPLPQEMYLSFSSSLVIKNTLNPSEEKRNVYWWMLEKKVEYMCLWQLYNYFIGLMYAVQCTDTGYIMLRFFSIHS